eukprot:XP_012824322.1 PREDICTED: protein Bop [Xenopus tropicalis]
MPGVSDLLPGERLYIVTFSLRSGYDNLPLGPLGVHKRKRAILRELRDGFLTGFALDVDLRLLQRKWSDLKRRNSDLGAEIAEELQLAPHSQAQPQAQQPPVAPEAHQAPEAPEASAPGQAPEAPAPAQAPDATAPAQAPDATAPAQVPAPPEVEEAPEAPGSPEAPNTPPP